MNAAQRSQKRALNPQYLKYQTVVTSPLWALGTELKLRSFIRAE